MAPAERIRLDAAVSFDHASRVLWSICRSVVVPAAAVLSSSYGVMLIAMCCGLIVFVAALPVGGRGRSDSRREVGERDLDLEVVAAGRAVAVVDAVVVRADPRRRRDDLDAGAFGAASTVAASGPVAKPWWLSASRSQHGPFAPLPLKFDGSFVNGKTPSLNVVPVSKFVTDELPRGSIRNSTESASQCATHSVGVTA